MLFTTVPNWITVISSWPSGTVVKMLACHTGGRGFECPLEQFFFFVFFLHPNLFSLHYITSLFSYLHNLDFFTFFLMLHVFSFLKLYRLTNSTISYFINELLLREDIIIASAHLSIWYSKYMYVLLSE